MRPTLLAAFALALAAPVVAQEQQRDPETAGLAWTVALPEKHRWPAVGRASPGSLVHVSARDVRFDGERRALVRASAPAGAEPFEDEWGRSVGVSIPRSAEEGAQPTAEFVALDGVSGRWTDDAPEPAERGAWLVASEVRETRGRKGSPTLPDRWWAAPIDGGLEGVAPGRTFHVSAGGLAVDDAGRGRLLEGAARPAAEAFRDEFGPSLRAVLAKDLTVELELRGATHGWAAVSGTPDAADFAVSGFREGPGAKPSAALPDRFRRMDLQALPAGEWAWLDARDVHVDREGGGWIGALGPRRAAASRSEIAGGVRMKRVDDYYVQVILPDDSPPAWAAEDKPDIRTVTADQVKGLRDPPKATHLGVHGFWSRSATGGARPRRK